MTTTCNPQRRIKLLWLAGLISFLFASEAAPQDRFSLSPPTDGLPQLPLWNLILPSAIESHPGEVTVSLSDYSTDEKRAIVRHLQENSVVQQAVPPNLYDALTSDFFQGGSISSSTEDLITTASLEYASNIYSSQPSVPTDCESAAFALVFFLADLSAHDKIHNTEKYVSLYRRYGDALNDAELERFGIIMTGYDQKCLQPVTTTSYKVANDVFLLGTIIDMETVETPTGDRAEIGPICTAFEVAQNMFVTASHCFRYLDEDFALSFADDPEERISFS